MALALSFIILLAIFLPYKEDITRDHYGTGPRRRKDAEVVDEDDDNDGCFGKN